MIQVQYNRNTFNPTSRKQWIPAKTVETTEQALEYLKATRKAFKECFGYPSDLQYRIKNLDK